MMDDEIKVTVEKLSAFRPDEHNANRGTERGDYQLTQSLEEDGAGRGILLSKDGVVLAGNKTFEKAGELGIEEVIVVRTTGRQLVAVQREDVPSTSTQARRMAIRDNRTAEVNLNWDPVALAFLQDEGVDLYSMWREDELNALMQDVASYRSREMVRREIGQRKVEQIGSKPLVCPHCGAEFYLNDQDGA